MVTALQDRAGVRYKAKRYYKIGLGFAIKLRGMALLDRVDGIKR